MQTIIGGIRAARGLSQQQLADLVGTSKSTISDYERRRKSPNFQTVDRLLEATNMRIELFERVNWRRYWHDGRVKFAPTELWRLPVRRAFRTVPAPPELAIRMVFSGLFDLADREARALFYRHLILEGSMSDMEQFIDGALLVDVFDSMELPNVARKMWEKAILASRY